MVPNRGCNMQLLAFTHRVIDAGLHQDVILYRALCAAYTRLLDAQTVSDETMLTRLFDRPCLTPATLLAEIEALIVARE